MEGIAERGGLLAKTAAAIGLAFCAVMGLWPETMETLALVMAASALALLIAIPLGIVAGFNPRLNGALLPVLDMIQTLPPYIYLLPAVALIGFGPATALAATVVEGGADLFTTPLPPRLVYVLGAEGGGMDRDLAAHCDLRVSIPGTGAVESLNVAAATAVLLARAAVRDR